MRRLPAYPIWLFMAFVGGFLHSAVFTVTAIYFVRDVGMDALQLVLVGTAMEFAAFTFEVPTGVVADVVSRRRSILIGFTLHGIAMIAIGWWPWFPSILAAYFVIGVGWTFVSGAATAWIADEIGTGRLGNALYRSSQLRYAGAFAGIGAGVGLATIALWVPIVVGGVGMLFYTAFLAVSMPETGFRPTPHAERGSWHAMRETLSEGITQVRHRPVLILLVGVAGLEGLFSEGIDRLSEPHFLLNLGFPTGVAWEAVVWLGAIRAGVLLLGFLGTEVARRKVDPARGEQARAALFWVTAVEVVATAGFAVAGRFELALIAFWLLGTARAVAQPIYSTWINQHIDSSVRATVNSISSQMDALGQVAGGPIVGVIGRAVSIPAALLVSSFAISPALWLYRRREPKRPS